jgi:membrane-associated phospholipid phosphatase
VTSWAKAATRAAVATAAVALITGVIRDDRVGPRERQAFRVINELPDGIYPPVWAAMQFGALGAVPLVSAIAWVKGERCLALRLMLAGSVTWALSKLFKREVRRPRPAALVPGTRVRGATPNGLGYLSGHAGVSAALAATIAPRVGTGSRAAIVTSASMVGLARMYVGAHLPLDVVAGAALGLAVQAATQVLVTDRTD